MNLGEGSCYSVPWRSFHLRQRLVLAQLLVQYFCLPDSGMNIRLQGEPIYLLLDSSPTQIHAQYSCSTEIAGWMHVRTHYNQGQCRTSSNRYPHEIQHE
jgi:hypothetical protein